MRQDKTAKSERATAAGGSTGEDPKVGFGAVVDCLAEDFDVVGGRRVPKKCNTTIEALDENRLADSRRAYLSINDFLFISKYILN